MQTAFQQLQVCQLSTNEVNGTGTTTKAVVKAVPGLRRQNSREILMRACEKLTRTGAGRTG